MNNGNKILAIIPARGGSKGLPGKNIKKLLGKPLIAYAIESIRSSKYSIDIIISTDSEEISNVGREYNAQTVYRPKNLATDTSLVKDAILYTINYLENIGNVYDTMILIEPTSPLRTAKDIDDSLDLFFKEKDADCLATYSMLEHPITRLWKIENNVPSIYLKEANPFKRRQDQEYVYYINGLVYVLKVDTLKSNNSDSLFMGKQLALITDKKVVDIDDEFDFYFAEQILKYQKLQINEKS